MQTEFAPAKINLTLHVTGQRADGYHVLDSLVVFAGVGDRVSADLATVSSLQITGPMAAGLTPGPDNLVQRAADLMGCHASLVLEKHLPVSSGIGGGSADAAATLRLLSRITGQPLPDEGAVLSLGADVPVCLQGRPLRMQGVGERLTPVPPLPAAWLVLVNPGVGVATPAVFRALASKINSPMPEAIPTFAAAADLAAFLSEHRNDLEAPALSIHPVIGTVRSRIAASPGCRIARMSGSGATCFGLFDTEAEARSARRQIQTDHPQWWVSAAPLLQI